MKASNKTWLLGCALALFHAAVVSSLAHAANCPPDGQPRRIVVTIGIDHYKNKDRWPTLTTAVNDANSLEHLLETKFAYQSYESLIPNSEPLREGKADRHAIDQLVVDGLPNVLCLGDDFILFYSGHGESRTYPGGDIKNATGYLVPFDAPSAGFSDLIEVKSFLENISHLPARHILVILDACHSGIAIQDALQGMKQSGDYKKALEKNPSRKVIVSAQAEQNASDKGSIPGHSLFGGLLLQALDQELAAKEGRAFIADSDLADFLKESVVEKNPLQLPDSAPFIGNAGGALVLNLNEDLVALYQNAIQSLVIGDDEKFRSNATKAVQRSPEEPRALILQYRLALREGKMDAASSCIDKLRRLATQIQTEAASMPLSRHELLIIKNQLTFWGNAIQLPVPTAPPAVDIHVFTGETEQRLLPLSGSNEFNVAAEAYIKFKLQAKEARTYVYVFLVDGLGRIRSEGDFLSQHQNPIDPKSEQFSAVQIGPDSNDIQEWHFIFSRHPIDELLSPPSDTSKGVSPVTAAELAGVSQYLVIIRPQK